MAVQNNSSCKGPDGVTSCKNSGMRQEQPLACFCGRQIKSSKDCLGDMGGEGGKC